MPAGGRGENTRGFKRRILHASPRSLPPLTPPPMRKPQFGDGLHPLRNGGRGGLGDSPFDPPVFGHFFFLHPPPPPPHSSAPSPPPPQFAQPEDAPLFTGISHSVNITAKLAAAASKLAPGLKKDSNKAAALGAAAGAAAASKKDLLVGGASPQRGRPHLAVARPLRQAGGCPSTPFAFSAVAPLRGRAGALPRPPAPAHLAPLTPTAPWSTCWAPTGRGPRSTGRRGRPRRPCRGSTPTSRTTRPSRACCWWRPSWRWRPTAPRRRPRRWGWAAWPCRRPRRPAADARRLASSVHSLRRALLQSLPPRATWTGTTASAPTFWRPSTSRTGPPAPHRGRGGAVRRPKLCGGHGGRVRHPRRGHRRVEQLCVPVRVPVRRLLPPVEPDHRQRRLPGGRDGGVQGVPQPQRHLHAGVDRVDQRGGGRLHGDRGRPRRLLPGHRHDRQVQRGRHDGGGAHVSAPQRGEDGPGHGRDGRATRGVARRRVGDGVVRVPVGAPPPGTTLPCCTRTRSPRRPR